MVFLVTVAALLVQGQTTDVSFKLGDNICDIHIRSVMARHGLTISGPIYRTNGIGSAEVTTDRLDKVSGPPDVVAAILKNEAPESAFDIGIEGKRQSTSVDSMLTWIALSKEEIAGTAHAPFSVSALLDVAKRDGGKLLKALNMSDVTGVKYAPRFYMGPDFDLHIALNVTIGTAEGPWKFEVIPNAPKIPGFHPEPNGDLISQPDLLSHLKSAGG